MQRVAVMASGSISLDIGGPLAPHGQIAGCADEAWVHEVLGYLKEAKHDDLLNTLARFSVFGITPARYMERIKAPTRSTTPR